MWESDKGLAKAMLRDRAMRRKIMARLLLLALAMMAVGLWAINGWLMGSPWRFLLWWGGCAFLTCMSLLFAVYDLLAVVREERERM